MGKLGTTQLHAVAGVSSENDDDVSTLEFPNFHSP
jgi:hypothetical protein